MCDEFTKSGKHLEAKIYDAFEMWGESVASRVKEVDKVLALRDVQESIAKSFLDKAGTSLEEARMEIRKYLKNKHTAELDRLRHVEMGRAEGVLQKTNEVFRELLETQANLRSTLEQAQKTSRSLAAKRETSLDKFQGSLKSNVARIERDILRVTGQIQDFKNEHVDTIIARRRRELVAVRLKELAKVKGSFDEYRLQLTKVMEDIETVMTTLDQTVNEAREQVVSSKKEWSKRLIKWSKDITKECEKVVKVYDALTQQDAEFAARFVLKVGHKFYMGAASSKTDAPPPCVSSNKINPLPYQRLVQSMFLPGSGFETNGLLVYHDMGTGKTCSIVLIIEAMYKKYLEDDASKGLSVEVIPCILVLVQNHTALGEFSATVGRSCTTQTNLSMRWNKVSFDSNRALMYVLTHKGDRPVLRVVTQRMDVQVDEMVQRVFAHGYRQTPRPVDYCNNKVKWVDDSKRRFLPHRGAVIVDEAHNLFNSMDITRRDMNATQLILEQIYERRDLPLILSTGTPVLDMNKPGHLFQLLDFIRRPCDPKQALWPSKKYNDHEGIIKEFFIKANLSEEDMADENQVTPPTYVQGWKPGKQEEFRSKVMGYVSFMTLENDPTRYPRQVARLPDHKMSFTSSYNVTVSVSAQAVVSFRDMKEVTAKNGLPLVKLMIPTHPDQWAIMSACKGIPKGASNRRTDGNPAIPHKWIVLKTLMTHYGKGHKHFVFHPTGGGTSEYMSGFRGKGAKARSGLIDYLRQSMDIVELSYDNDFFDPEKNSKAMGNDETYIQTLVNTWYKRHQPARRCAHLLDATGTSKSRKPRDNRVILGIYNDDRNVYGEYICVMLANMPHKEGVSLFATGFTHIMQPLTNISAQNQVAARTKRNCGFKQIPDTSQWLTTMFIYVATTPDGTISSRRRRALQQIDKAQKAKLEFEVGASNPAPFLLSSELALETLERSAIDCVVFRDYLRGSSNTRGTCFLPRVNTFLPDKDLYSATNGACYDLTGKKPPLVIGYHKDGQSIRTVEECFAKEMVPGGMLVHSEHDELLYQLLIATGYTPKPLSDPRILRDFPKYVNGSMQKNPEKKGILSRILDFFSVGKWFSTKQNVHLTLSSDVPPIMLLQWIMKNPDEVGNAVVFLLRQKRDTASPGNVEKILKLVQPQVNAFLIDFDRRKEVDAFLNDVESRIHKASERLHVPLADLRRLLKKLQVSWDYSYELS